MSAVLQNVVRARGIAARLESTLEAVGPDLTVRRALPAPDMHSVGPWVFLDHFGPVEIAAGTRGVPPHPHAGIETVTYLFEGGMQHRDSAGHSGAVGAGGAQWMTSGRGIVHAERPAAGVLHGIQFWTSLPRAKKLMAPGYQRIAAAEIPEVPNAGSVLRIVAGEHAQQAGPAHVEMPLFLWHLELAPGAHWQAPVPADFEAGAYVVSGAGRFGADGVTGGTGQLLRFADLDGALAVSNPGEAPLQVMLFGGNPAEGPLVFQGPFVMTTPAQVRAAYHDYTTGRMGRLDPEEFTQ
jgi:hypothetical protein